MGRDAPCAAVVGWGDAGVVKLPPFSLPGEIGGFAQVLGHTSKQSRLESPVLNK